jgi:uncharacterized protein (TIGR02246 family)
MPAKTPEDVHKLFLEAINAGHKGVLLDLYEANASVVSQPGQIVSGRNAINAVLAQFISINTQFQFESDIKAVSAGDVAVLHTKWTATATPPNGETLNLAGTTADVVRRQADGTWQMLIHNPYGDAGVHT